MSRNPTHHALAAATLMGAAALPLTAGAQVGGAQPTEEIVVTSSLIPTPRRQIGAAVSVIDFDDIELRGYTSLADVLRTQPGIAVSNSGGPGKSTSLRIRGEESFRTLLMIDGVKALDPSGPQVAPSFDSLLATTDLQRVEVLRGPQGFIFGADAGGVVNVMTKRGTDEFGGGLGFEYGSDSTRKLDGAFSGGSDNGDYFVSLTDLSTDGFNAQTVDTVLRDKDGADNTTLHAKLGWNVSENVRLQFVMRDIDAETAYDGCFSLITFTTVHDCTGTTDQKTYKASVDFAAGNFTSSFGLSNIETKRDNFTAGAPSFDTVGELGRFEYTGSYKPSDAFGLVFGLDFQDEELLDGTTPRSRDQKGYYVEYQGAFDDSFFISLGARYDDNDDFGTHTSSRLSLAYVQDLSSDSALKYRASIGTGFRAPSLFEIAYNAGPFSLPPAAGLVLNEESSKGYDLGIEYDAANGLHFEVTYFDQDIEDEIFFDLATFSGYLQSPGMSTSKGLEIGAAVPMGDRWRFLANWTNNDAESSTNERRLRRPESIANLGVSYRRGDGRLNFIANYRLAKNAIDSGNVALDDYGVLDFSVNVDLDDNVELFARVQNAGDETYQEMRGFHAAGRSAFAGARWRF